MKRNYRIVEYGGGKNGANRYTVQEEKFWGLYWGTPTDSSLCQLICYPSGMLRLAPRLFDSISDAEIKIAAVITSDAGTPKVIKVIPWTK